MNRRENSTEGRDPIPSPFEWIGGVPTFRRLPVELHRLKIAGLSLTVAALKDAADLLDEADFASRFLDEDVAPYGVELWSAAVLLAEFIARIRGDFAPHRPTGCSPTVIELGCGLGLVSIVAAKLGWQVTASDYEDTALAFARYNAQLNDAPIAEWLLLDWRDPPRRHFDLILGADILYQLTDHRPILHCIDQLLAPGGRAFIADPDRGIADRFPDAARHAGYEVEIESLASTAQTGRAVRGRVFRLYRP